MNSPARKFKTPEEIDKIYIQEHGMTKGAFSVGLHINNETAGAFLGC